MTVRVTKGKLPDWMSDEGDVSAALVAKDGRKEIGRMHLQANSKGVRVTWIEVDSAWRRHGVATRMYEAAAKLSCKKWRRPLMSDDETNRATAASAFWLKQEAKGRAGRVTYAGAQHFVLSCPAPASLAGNKRRRR